MDPLLFSTCPFHKSISQVLSAANEKILQIGGQAAYIFSKSANFLKIKKKV